MASWVKYVWWPLMVALTVSGVGSVGWGLWLLVFDGQVVGLISAVPAVVWLVIIGREWPHWREVTFGTREQA